MNYSTKNDPNDELYHYGVKGMKWGVRRKQTTFERDGSSKTVKKLNKLLDADAKYGSTRTVRQNNKINKLYKKYDQSVSKDIKKASKQNNTKAVNSMLAGRTFMKTLMDGNYMTIMVNETATKAKVKAGKDFTYNFTRDDKMGGVKVTVNDVSNSYVYLPELKRK